jgi:ribosome-binding factor A
MPSQRSSKPVSQRQLRVGEELRHIVAEIFQADRLHDPDLVGKVITATEVRVSPDLRNATVYVMPLGTNPDEEKSVLQALGRAAPHITSLVAGQLRARRAPRLTFQRDDSFDKAQSIDALLRDPKVARDLSD